MFLNRVLWAVVAATALLLLSTATRAQSVSAPAAVQSQYIQVLKLVAGKEYAEALLECQHLIVQQPRFTPAYDKLVECAHSLGRLEWAQGYFERLLAEPTPNPLGHYGLALVQQRRQDFKQASHQARQALELTPDLPAVYTLYANVVTEAKKTTDAAAFAEELAFLNELQRRYPQIAEVNYGLGYFYRKLNRWNDALSALDKALTANPSLEAAKQTKGIVFYFTGRYQEAMLLNRELLAIGQANGDVDRQLAALATLGILNRLLGNSQQSLQDLQETLRLALELGDRTLQNTCYSNLGGAYLQQDDYVQALSHYRQGLQLARELKNVRSEGRYLGQLGFIQRQLGDLIAARHLGEQGLAIARRPDIADEENQAALNTDLGSLLVELKEFEPALANFNEALRITRKNKNPTLECDALAGLGKLYGARGDYQTAFTMEEQALQRARQIGSPGREGASLNYLGWLKLKVAEPRQAAVQFEAAQALGKQFQLPNVRWQALAGLGATYERLGDLASSRGYYFEALKVLEDVRAMLKVAEDKAGFWQDKVELYRNLISVLQRLHQRQPKAGFAREAFLVAERARARVLLDSLGEMARMNRLLAPELLAEQQGLQERFSRLETELGKAQAASPRDAQKIGTLQASLQQVSEELLQWQQLVRQRQPRYAELRYPQPLNVEQVQQLLKQK